MSSLLTRFSQQILETGKFLLGGTTAITKRTSSCTPMPRVTHAWPSQVVPGFTCGGETREGKGLILGMYSPCEDSDNPTANEECILTRTAYRFNDYSCGRLSEQLQACGRSPRLGEARLFYNVHPSFPVVAVVGLGHECYGYNKNENRDEGKEAIRLGVGAGCRAIQELHICKLYLESFGHTESAAEAAALALWIYQDMKTKKQRIPFLGLYDDNDWTGWQVGLEKAAAQNMARQLMEAPSNIMTPVGFALSAVEALCKTGVNVEVRVDDWARENNMNAFLAVAKGSMEHPIFLEISYNGCDPCEAPIVLVGKGITFDAGGLCLQPLERIQHQRGDMAGAACVVASVRAAASLRLPINIRGIIPLCENIPGASAMKPGDIVTAMNGKTILIKNTDYEGPLILADALSYAQKYRPKFIIDVGTLTGAMEYAMGAACTGVFTNDDNLWISMKAASIHTGDRLWRFPLWNDYQQLLMLPHMSVDLTNYPETNSGQTCAIAAFLSNFICYHRWLHMDTYGVMRETGETPYLREGMSGRPTRTLIEFLAQFACKPAEC